MEPLPHHDQDVGAAFLLQGFRRDSGWSRCENHNGVCGFIRVVRIPQYDARLPTFRIQLGSVACGWTLWQPERRVLCVCDHELSHGPGSVDNANKNFGGPPITIMEEGVFAGDLHRRISVSLLIFTGPLMCS